MFYSTLHHRILRRRFSSCYSSFYTEPSPIFFSCLNSSTSSSHFPPPSSNFLLIHSLTLSSFLPILLLVFRLLVSSLSSFFLLLLLCPHLFLYFQFLSFFYRHSQALHDFTARCHLVYFFYALHAIWQMPWLLYSLWSHFPYKFPYFSPQVAPCVNNTKVDFAWIVTCTDASAKQKVESSASFQATKNQATLKVSQGVLTGGVTCTFNVTGSMNYDPSVKSSVTQEIKALSTPIEPAIFGGKVESVCRKNVLMELFVLNICLPFVCCMFYWRTEYS